MSIVATYARMDEEARSSYCGNANWMEALSDEDLSVAQVIDIDKACDGLVWLLERVPQSAPPTEGGDFVLKRNYASLLRGQGGQKEPSLKAPYGPAFWLNAPQVAAVASWLQGVTPGQLRQAYDPSAMQRDEVYPEIWEDEGQARLEKYLLPYYASLQSFFAEANRSEQGMLVYFT